MSNEINVKKTFVSFSHDIWKLCHNDARWQQKKSKTLSTSASEQESEKSFISADGQLLA